MEVPREVSETRIDPFTLEIIRATLIATTEEMKGNLIRTAYSRAIYEMKDFTVALTTPQGGLISIGLGLPSFIRGIADTVKAMVNYFGDNIQPGDVLLTNDAFTHGSHLNHVIMAKPIFHEGRVIAYSCAEPHWLDIGGQVGGNPTDIYSEGLQIPYVKIYRKNELDDQLLRMIAANVRNPEVAMGDFRGEVACVRTGEKRILGMIEKYGASNLENAIEHVMHQADLYSRSMIRKIPPGTYEAEQFMDDDGIDIGKHIPIKVKITVKGERMTIDLSGVGKQVRGHYNSRAGITGAQLGFKTVICPSWYPVNDGSFRSLDVILPPGTIVSAERPAAMRTWMKAPMTIADTIWKALADALPDTIAAGHHGDLTGGGASPIDPITRRVITNPSVAMGAGLIGGGWGGRPFEDGVSATIALNNGDEHNLPIEATEFHDASKIVLRYELRQDSGGAGKYRGGLGAMREMVIFTEGMMNSGLERCLCTPWGLLGGKNGLGSALDVDIPERSFSPEDAKTRDVLVGSYKHEHYPNENHPNGKLSNRLVPIGTRIMPLSGGGGGWGDPLERNPQKVLEDVHSEYISRESAEGDYGVVIDWKTMKVDSRATNELRERLHRAADK